MKAGATRLGSPPSPAKETGAPPVHPSSDRGCRPCSTASSCRTKGISRAENPAFCAEGRPRTLRGKPRMSGSSWNGSCGRGAGRDEDFSRLDGHVVGRAGHASNDRLTSRRRVPARLKWRQRYAAVRASHAHSADRGRHPDRRLRNRGEHRFSASRGRRFAGWWLLVRPNLDAASRSEDSGDPRMRGTGRVRLLAPARRWRSEPGPRYCSRLRRWQRRPGPRRTRGRSDPETGALVRDLGDRPHVRSLAVGAHAACLRRRARGNLPGSAKAITGRRRLQPETNTGPLSVVMPDTREPPKPHSVPSEMPCGCPDRHSRPH